MKAPATRPIMIAAQGSTNAQAPVIATSAASTPFSIAGMSDLPKYSQEATSAARPPAAAAMLVVSATCPKKPPIGDNALPGLKPNQPNQRMITPSTVNTWL
ncbi:hypothetical protein D3C80_1505980 [compost metagenome]